MKEGISVKQKIWMIGVMLLLGLALTACSDAGDSSSGSTLAETASVPAEESSGLVAEGSSSGITQEESPEPQLHMMTVDEAVDFFMNLDPSLLGLPGDSMDKYQVYPTEKAVPVDGLPYMKLIVYGEGSAGTNNPEGTFLLSRDGARLYQLEEDEVIPIDFG